MFTGRKKIDYFADTLKKFEKKLAGWKSKILSHEGRIILIPHELQSLPIYNVAACDPPKEILNKIDGICANFCGERGKMGINVIGWGGENTVYHCKRDAWGLEVYKI